MKNKKGFTPLENSSYNHSNMNKSLISNAKGKIKSSRFLTGFTLIELLVAIAIIGILAAVVVLTVTRVRASARDSKRKMDLKQLQVALETYYDMNKAYPSTVVGGVAYQFNTCASYHGYGWELEQKSFTDWIPGLISGGYIGSLPLDPKRGTKIGNMDLLNPGAPANVAYCYIYQSNGADYKLTSYCSAESETVNSSHPFYIGTALWSCNNHDYAIYTSGAKNW